MKLSEWDCEREHTKERNWCGFEESNSALNDPADRYLSEHIKKHHTSCLQDSLENGISEMEVCHLLKKVRYTKYDIVK